MIIAICPVCAHENQLPIESLMDWFNATFDCKSCGSLLIITRPGGEIKNFHVYMKEKTNGEWPKDGKGTGFVDV